MRNAVAVHQPDGEGAPTSITCLTMMSSQVFIIGQRDNLLSTPAPSMPILSVSG